MHHHLLLILALLFAVMLLVLLAKKIKVAYPIFLVIAGLGGVVAWYIGGLVGSSV